MKRTFIILLISAISLVSAQAREFTYTYKGNTLKYSVLNEENKEVQVGRNYSVSEILEIPSTVSDGNTEYSVTSIGDYAFYRCSGLTSVTIPESVTSIGDHAFYDCSGLTKAEFGSIESLCKIKFGGTAANPLYYAHHLYINGIEIKDLVIPESVNAIGDYAFDGCSGLTSVTIPNSVTSIGDNAFLNCTGLTKAEFGSIESLCNLDFKYGRANPLTYAHNLYINGIEIKDLVIPESVTAIGDCAFDGCSGLTSVTIPESVTSIGYGAFAGCSGLTKAEFGSIESLCKIKFGGTAANPLYYAHHLYINGIEIKDLVIPESVTAIGDYAFDGCSGLTSVTIHNSVTSIGRSAFAGCNGLTKAEFGSIESLCNLDFKYGLYSNPLIFAHNLYINGQEINDLVIPESVTSIGNYAFSGCSGLTSVTIPNSVTSIGDYAFDDCSGLSSVTIPNSVNSIGEYGFTYCRGLTEVTIPESVTSIGDGTFKGCWALTSVTIPNSVTSIGYEAFCVCCGLTSVTIPNSVTSIGNYAFEGCSGLTEVVTLSEKPATIYDDSFRGVYDKAFLIIPDRSADKYLITYWAQFKNIRQSGADNLIATHNDGVLNYCLVPALSSDGKNTAIIIRGDYSGEISIPERFAYTSASGETERYYVNGIGCNAFANSSINKISFNSRIDLKTIGDGAFSNCKNLTEISIPKTVETIGLEAFSGCTGLTKAEFASIESLCKIKFAYYYSNPLYYAHHLYINGIEIKDLVIPESVTAIGNDAFEGCSGLTSVTIPESVTSIGDYAFDRCSGLSSVTIPNSVTSIGDYAFSNCSGLSSVTIPNSVTSIGNYAFSGCSGLTSVTIPNSVTSIGNRAFDGCSGLSSVTIPNSVTSIGSYAFQSCNRLTSVIIPNSVTSIGQSAFSSCKGLIKSAYPNTLKNPFLSGICIGYNPDAAIFENGCIYAPEMKEILFVPLSLTGEYNLPNSITSIGDGAFAYCDGLTSMTIDNSVKTIGDYAFYGCKFTQITIPASVESIGAQAIPATEVIISDSATPLRLVNDSFSNNLTSLYWGRTLNYFNIPKSSLQIVEIGNIAEEIPAGLFSGCSSITSLTLGSGLTTIGDNAFNGCTGLSSVTIPNLVSSIGDYAFYGCKFTQITIPASVESIGAQAIPATEVIISDSATPLRLVNDSFSNNLTSLYWGRTLNYFNIPKSSLQIVEIGNIAEEIPAGLFSGCSSITSLTLGSGLTTIGDIAFNGCTGLTEVVLPPAIETIGASSFAGCSELSTIIMGSKVKTIGEKAFDGCPAKIVKITAQTPPTAPNNTFSTYSGKLYLQGQEAIDAYYDAYTCWDRFDSYTMIEPEKIEVSETNVSGRPGESLQLSASLKPDNVTLPQIFWYSTNPEIATVDKNGLVTFMGGSRMATRAAKCKIIATSLYADGPVAEVTVTSEDILVTSLSFRQSSYTVEVGETIDLNDEVMILPANAADKRLKWKSSNEEVAKVSDGVVTVLAKGSAEITVTTTDGSNLSAVSVINVSSGVESVMAAGGLCDVYSLSGILIMHEANLSELSSLAPGIYIVRKGNQTTKIVVK